MELKLSVSIGATLQVKNAKGEWDWIKPEVGAEISLNPNEIRSPIPLDEEADDLTIRLQAIFGNLWDDVVGPQFKNVVNELIADPVATVEEAKEESTETTEEDEKPNVDEDDYY